MTEKVKLTEETKLFEEKKVADPYIAGFIVGVQSVVPLYLYKGWRSEPINLIINLEP
jgi:hypothetical protein